MKELIDVEGIDFSDVPWDNGGPTKYGITLATFRAAMKDDNLTAEDLQSLTPADAAEIYRAVYWPKWMDDPAVPECIATWVFVNGVNEPMTLAIRQAQRAAGTKPDGWVGPQTIAKFAAVEPEHFLVEAGLYREARDRTLKDYDEARDGWMRRLLDTTAHCARLVGAADA